MDIEDPDYNVRNQNPDISKITIRIRNNAIFLGEKSGIGIPDIRTEYKSYSMSKKSIFI